MKTNQGWIKIHRKFTKWEWLDKPEMVSLFLYLLLMANHEKGTWRGQTIERGQFITGRHSLSQATGISEQSIRTCLKRLKSTNEITTKSTNKYSVITIVKYDDYQSDERKSTNKRTQEQPTTNQQLTTNNNKNKNKKDIYIADKSANDNKLQDLYNNFGFPKKSKTVNQWQDEASNAISYLKDSKGKESSIFKCYKDNQSKARIALSDCKELGKPHTMYFFKIYNEIKN